MHPRISFLLLAVVSLTGLRGQVGDSSALDRSDPPVDWKIPEAPVRSPEESLKLFDLPEGFRAEVVAAEPLVQDPISISFDERGRLWVLEWPAYNWQLRDGFLGLEKQNPPASRVVILEDTDGDGRMDRRTVFMDGIVWPRGLQPMKDGALILKLPEIVFAQDTDGDGKADREQVLVRGLEIPANPHGAQSSLLRGMDNWIHGLQFPQRMRPAAEAWHSEPTLSQHGQWGITQDNYGRLFYAWNGDHLRGDLVPGHYFARNPNTPLTAGTGVRLAQDQTTWPHAATSGTNRRSQQRDENGTLRTFTSNTAPTVYRGDQFPREFAGNVFLGEVAGRLVRRSVLTEKDGLITARNAYHQREFLFSHDERFRPVYTANGPDGALYIADMHRGIIEGHLFITSYLQKQIMGRGLHQPLNGMGRVYRIVHKDRAPQSPPPLRRDDLTGWVERLAHPNGFWRDTAQRVIVESEDRRVVPALRKMALGHPDELARLHALWTLEGLAAIDRETLARALADESHQVRLAAIRLSEPFLADEAFAGKVLALAGDQRIEVRRQLLFSLGEGRGRKFEEGMIRLLERDAGQLFMVEAALSGLRGRELGVLEGMLQAPVWREERPGFARLFAALSHAVINAGTLDELERLLAAVSDAGGKPLWARQAVLGGLADAKKKGLALLPAALAALRTSADESIRRRAETLGKAWAAPVPVAATLGSGVPAGPVFDKGRRFYAVCAACHGPEGKGQPGIAPPLEGSAVVASASDEVIRSVLFGRNQDRKNVAFPDMPPFGGFGDEDVAAIVSFVKARWGGQPRMVTAAEVQQVREAAGSAPQPPR